MDKTDYKIKPGLRKRMMHKYVITHKTGRALPGLIISYILLAAGIIIGLGWFIALLITQDRAVTVLIGFLGGLLFFLIFFIFAFFIKYKVYYNLGAPYSYMSKEFVLLEDAGMEFGYHDISAHETPLRYSFLLHGRVYDSSVNNLNCRMIYQFFYENISNVEYDPKCMLLTITGGAVRLYYDDYVHDQVHYETKDELSAARDFSFILATDHAEKIVKILKDNVEKNKQKQKDRDSSPVSIDYERNDASGRILGVSAGGELPDEAGAIYTFAVLSELVEHIKGIKRNTVCITAEDGMKITALHHRDGEEVKHSVLFGEEEIELYKWMRRHAYDWKGAYLAKKIYRDVKQEMSDQGLKFDEEALQEAVKEYGL